MQITMLCYAIYRRKAFFVEDSREGGKGVNYSLRCDEERE